MKSFKEYTLNENKLTKVSSNSVVHVYKHDDKGTYHMTLVGAHKNGPKKLKVNDHELQSNFKSSKSEKVINQHAKKAERFWNKGK